jgi:hypothetical protein
MGSKLLAALLRRDKVVQESHRTRSDNSDQTDYIRALASIANQWHPRLSARQVNSSIFLDKIRYSGKTDSIRARRLNKRHTTDATGVVAISASSRLCSSYKSFNLSTCDHVDKIHRLSVCVHWKLDVRNLKSSLLCCSLLCTTCPACEIPFQVFGQSIYHVLLSIHVQSCEST